MQGKAPATWQPSGLPGKILESLRQSCPTGGVFPHMQCRAFADQRREATTRRSGQAARGKCRWGHAVSASLLRAISARQPPPSRYIAGPRQVQRSSLVDSKKASRATHTMHPGQKKHPRMRVVSKSETTLATRASDKTYLWTTPGILSCFKFHEIGFQGILGNTLDHGFVNQTAATSEEHTSSRSSLSTRGRLGLFCLITTKTSSLPQGSIIYQRGKFHHSRG